MCNEKLERKYYHYIYKIIFLKGSPENRYYIGKRSFYGVSIEKDRYTGSGNFCFAYFKKYGTIYGETYIREILEINPSKEINRQREEIIVGDLWKTDTLCMNQIPGGLGLTEGCESPNKGKSLSDTAKKKISKALKGRKKSPEAIEKIRLGHVGKKHSEETKKKLSKVFRKVKRHPIYQLDKNNKIVNVFDSTHDVERKLGFAHQNIINCCKGKLSTAYGYKWIYEEDYKCQLQSE